MRSRLALAALLAGCGGPPDDAPFPGYAEADMLLVAAPAAGTLQTLSVERGARVGKGQPLFTLDTDAEALGREGAAARREGAEAQAANLRKGRRPLELKAIDEQLAQARAALAASGSALQRQQALVAEGFVSPGRLDELQAARDRDAARVKELQAQRGVAAEAARGDEIAAAAAAARAAAAEVELARWREGQRSRTAPADALVHDVMYRPGEWVAAGAPVVALLPPAALHVRFFVPQAMLSRVNPGGMVELRCDGCPAPVAARIRQVATQAEYTPPVLYGNGARAKLVFRVEAVPAEPAALKPGQPLDVRLK